MGSKAQKEYAVCIGKGLPGFRGGSVPCKGAINVENGDFWPIIRESVIRYARENHNSLKDMSQSEKERLLGLGYAESSLKDYMIKAKKEGSDECVAIVDEHCGLVFYEGDRRLCEKLRKEYEGGNQK